jgi:hypothetical protein
MGTPKLMEIVKLLLILIRAEHGRTAWKIKENYFIKLIKCVINLLINLKDDTKPHWRCTLDPELFLSCYHVTSAI